MLVAFAAAGEGDEPEENVEVGCVVVPVTVDTGNDGFRNFEVSKNRRGREEKDRDEPPITDTTVVYNAVLTATTISALSSPSVCDEKPKMRCLSENPSAIEIETSAAAWAERKMETARFQSKGRTYSPPLMQNCGSREGQQKAGGKRLE